MRGKRVQLEGLPNEQNKPSLDTRLCHSRKEMTNHNSAAEFFQCPNTPKPTPFELAQIIHHEY